MDAPPREPLGLGRRAVALTPLTAKPVTLPNLITLARLVCVPLTGWLIAVHDFHVAFWLFVAAGVSDAADGFLARHLHSRSTLGALLDPLADKALMVCVYVMLGLAGGLPIWVPALVVARDVMIVSGFLAAHMIGFAIRYEPLWIGKLNTVAQIALAAFVLARLGLDLDRRLLGAEEVSVFLLYIVATTTGLSGVAYFMRWVRDFSRLQGAR